MVLKARPLLKALLLPKATPRHSTDVAEALVTCQLLACKLMANLLDRGYNEPSTRRKVIGECFTLRVECIVVPTHVSLPS
jgi:hypothetical protein